MDSMSVKKVKGLGEVIGAAANDDVILLDDGSPVAVVMSAKRHEALLDELDDLRDTVDILKADPNEETIPLEQVISDLNAQAS